MKYALIFVIAGMSGCTVNGPLLQDAGCGPCGQQVMATPSSPAVGPAIPLEAPGVSVPRLESPPVPMPGGSAARRLFAAH